MGSFCSSKVVIRWSAVGGKSEGRKRAKSSVVNSFNGLHPPFHPLACKSEEREVRELGSIRSTVWTVGEGNGMEKEGGKGGWRRERK